MYDREFSFTGKHAIMIDSLTKFPFRNEEGTTPNKFVFKTNIDVFLVAPLIGVLFDKKSSKDSASNSSKIFSDQFSSRYDDIEFLIKLVVLTHSDKSLTDAEKIDLAFKGYYETEQRVTIKSLFESYLYGGIEYLYEELIENTKNLDEVYHNFISFNQLFQGSYDSDLLDINFQRVM